MWLPTIARGTPRTHCRGKCARFLDENFGKNLCPHYKPPSRQLGWLRCFRFQHQSNEQLPRWHFLLQSVQSRVQHRYSRVPLQAVINIASARIVWLDRLCRSFPENNRQWSSVQRAHSRLAPRQSRLATEWKFYRSWTWYNSVRPHYKCDTRCSSCYFYYQLRNYTIFSKFAHIFVLFAFKSEITKS